MKILRIHLFLVCAFALSAIAAQAAQLGSAKVLDTKGTVAKSDATGAESKLQKGDVLKEGDSILTTESGLVELVFSNGSRLTVEPDSSLTFAEMRQEAFSSNQSYEQLNADPSASQNRLELHYGKVSGEVKRLHNGSNFLVQTPVGTAAIRGTRFSVEARFDAARNEFVLVIDNKNGLVDLISNFSGTLDFGRDTTAEIGFNGTDSESTRTAIPPGHKAAVRFSRSHPQFNNYINPLRNFAPPRGSMGRDPIIIPLPRDSNAPEITPEDPGVIIISPES